MKPFNRLVPCLLGALALLGGNDGHASSFGPPAADKIAIQAASSITTNSSTTLTVTVTRPNGVAEADGTVVTASVSPLTLGKVAASSNATAGGVTATGTLAGGTTSFIFVSSGSSGAAAISISVPPVNGHPTSVVAATTITITQGDGNNPSLYVMAPVKMLPLNPYSFGAQESGQLGFPTNTEGSPYVVEVDILWRGLLSNQFENGTVNVAISPNNIAAFSTLDDPTTQWSGQTATPYPTVVGNEFLTLLGTGTAKVTAGVGTIFLHAGNIPGTATLIVTATDPDTSQTISSQIPIAVAGAAPNNLPASVSISSGGGAYINGSNGPHNTVVNATVTDGSGAVVADPAKNVDNVIFSIVGPSGNGALLYGVNANGTPQNNTWVKTATHNGVASVSFAAGSQVGPVQVQAITDGSDNDAGNGIANPISATISVIVSDGQLYALQITTPHQGAIAVNGVTITPPSSTSGDTTTPTIPPNPNGTYSFTVSAIATDREGNPVLPGTPISFGVIDTPQTANFSETCPGTNFQICGFAGNPQPGGKIFSALDGRFVSAGAGPGDTLVVFGKQSQGAPAGNDDLESAVKISSVLNNTLLDAITSFNLNDTSGHSVNPGATLRYVIGRATIGNINSPVFTDVNGVTTPTGVATTTLNYPVSQLDKSVVIWAQGTGTDSIAKNATRLVTDALVTGYPGVAPATVVASPNPIAGNISIPVEVCIVDAVLSPLPGLAIGFQFSNLGAGSGEVDGIDAAGVTAEITGPDGCLVANVLTQGIAGGTTSGGSSGTPTLTFSSGNATSAVVPITAGGNLVLLASPSSKQISGDASFDVTLTLLASNGTKVPAAQLTGSCSAGVNLNSGPGTTNTGGVTNATIEANLDAYVTPKTGTCTFATATGSPMVTVNLVGTDLCLANPQGNSGCQGYVAPKSQ